MGVAVPRIVAHVQFMAELAIIHEFVSLSRDFCTLIEMRRVIRAPREQYL
jgi:hypothetical protein